MSEKSVSQSPVVGILGGMGPAATVDFYSKLIEATPATTDQGHLRVVMESIYAVKANRVSDEQRASLVGVASRLADSGADVVVVGCTEIPLALSEEQSPRPLIDPARLLALRVVQEAARR